MIKGREFFTTKMQAVTISEPRSSLVNILRLPTSYLYREGRSIGVLLMEAMPVNHRGSRVGMCRKLNCPVLEIHNGGGETADCCV